MQIEESNTLIVAESDQDRVVPDMLSEIEGTRYRESDCTHHLHVSRIGNIKHRKTRAVRLFYVEIRVSIAALSVKVKCGSGRLREIRQVGWLLYHHIS